MFTLHPSPLLLAAVLAAGVGVAAAEKADRSKPMTLESDQPCTLNLLKQTSVCSGNVSISQGTLLIRADRLSPDERDWLNAYHAEVLARLSPRLSAAAQAWLQTACAQV